jgi:hypothetical protein
VLEAGNNTKFQLLPLFNIVEPFLGLTRNLGACQALNHSHGYVQTKHKLISA